MDYKCEECPAPCVLKTKYVATKPDRCPFNAFFPNWKLNRTQDRKLEKAIRTTFHRLNLLMNEKASEEVIRRILYKLNLLICVYIGEQQINRGDYLTHDQVWKRIERKIKNAEKTRAKKAIPHK